MPGGPNILKSGHLSHLAWGTAWALFWEFLRCRLQWVIVTAGQSSLSPSDGHFWLRVFTCLNLTQVGWHGTSCRITLAFLPSSCANAERRAFSGRRLKCTPQKNGLRFFLSLEKKEKKKEKKTCNPFFRAILSLSKWSQMLRSRVCHQLQPLGGIFARNRSHAFKQLLIANPPSKTTTLNRPSLPDSSSIWFHDRFRASAVSC